MSPKQASGKSIDKRADIWSFGAVLYEMLSGKKAFEGESISDTLATVMKLDPDWSALPQNAPASVQKLVRRCLTKDNKQRLRDIGEARIMLENAAVEEASEVSAPSRSRLGTVATITAAVLSVVAVVAGFGWWRSTRPVERSLMRFSADLGPGAVEGLGYFVVDDRNGYRPAGLDRFARSKGGHLRDDPARGRFGADNCGPQLASGFEKVERFNLAQMRVSTAIYRQCAENRTVQVSVRTNAEGFTCQVGIPDLLELIAARGPHCEIAVTRHLTDAKL